MGVIVPHTPMATAADFRHCRMVIRAGSKTFSAASRLLPGDMSDAACALYAFCRVADDAVDVDGGCMPAVAALQSRLDRVYAGRPNDHPIDRAFAETVALYVIPKTLPEALIEGLAWDACGHRRYVTLSDVYAYAARVAGAVGGMMSLVMGRREPDTVARACDLGVAMQLSNIARDVGEDARNARLYLPRQWLADEGIDPDAWLAAPVFDAALGRVVARLLAEADGLYRRADPGIDRLPFACRGAIHAARLMYAEIGAEVGRNGFNSVDRRAVVPARRKRELIGRAVAAWMMPRRMRPAPVLPENSFLVDAVTATHPPTDEAIAAARTLDDRIAWLAGLLVRLDAQDQVSRSRS